MTATAEPRIGKAYRLSVRGLVQGVGFRPFVHRLAVRHGLCGWVRNESGSVEIAVEGPIIELERFVRALRGEVPPLARVDDISTVEVAAFGAAQFRIVASESHADARQPVSPDVSICVACAAELLDPSNRRYRYPFITCTDCGPRFTVIEAMPYDRERTTMRVFSQCARCLAEYRSPLDRRYHSETNSCPECGPRLWAERAGEEPAVGEEALARAARVLVDGGVVAVRGLGGFHLAVDATNESAVRRLRARKAREAKPLAIMVRTLEEARALADVGPLEAALLASRERPIVLVGAHAAHPLAPAIAPGLGSVGVMLAYTPLHHLLLGAVRRALVMTSGNVSEEPIATANDDAIRRLGEIADVFLLHDREIVTRYDDSVLRVAAGAPLFLRRARGYAPLPIDLPIPAPRPLLAVGPHLKNTFALAHGRRAYVSQHIGDLENLETLSHFRASLDALARLFHVDPEVAVCDRHPGYLSTRVAADLSLGETVVVQHHHAHVAAVAAEYGLVEPVIGVAFDGVGHGDDGAVWGAEVLVADLTAYERRGHLRYCPLPGGDVAARQPWRVALGMLSLEPTAAAAFALAFEGVPERERVMAARQIERRLNTPLASSMGRLFDAAAAVLGLRRVTSYEGQAAMELEAAAGDRPGGELPFPAREQDGVWEWDPLPLLVALGERRRGGGDPRDLAARFHESIAASTARVVAAVAGGSGIGRVALGGGVFQNRRLLESLVRRLEVLGLTVLVPRQLSPNDGAISYGQAAVAAAVLSRRVAS